MRIGQDISVLGDHDTAAGAVQCFLSAVVDVDLNVHDGILDSLHEIPRVGIGAVAVIFHAAGRGVPGNSRLEGVDHLLCVAGEAAAGILGIRGASIGGSRGVGYGGAADHAHRLVGGKCAAESRTAAEYCDRGDKRNDPAGLVGVGLLRGLRLGGEAALILLALCILTVHAVSVVHIVHVIVIVVIHRSFNPFTGHRILSGYRFSFVITVYQSIVYIR
jgi:hypothetical protein